MLRSLGDKLRLSTSTAVVFILSLLEESKVECAMEPRNRLDHLRIGNSNLHRTSEKF